MAKIYWFLGHEQFQPETLVRHAVIAERVGFDGVMVSEHFHPWVEDGSASGFAFATLGAIAQATQRIELMTAVTTPLFRYHPAVVAQAAATIDRLSRGRFALGIGTGENLNEAPLGYDFPAYTERSERLREALTIMQRLLAGEKLSFSGKYYRAEAAKLYSPPVSTVPIYVAAGGPKTARLAGELADGVIMSVKNIADAREQVVYPARTAAGPKLWFTLVANRWTVLARNDDEAWQALGPWRGLRAPSRSTATDPAQLQAEADALPREEILSRYTIAREVSDFTRIYAPLITDLGADIIGVQATSLDQEQLIRELGQTVVPELQTLGFIAKELT
jgi:coenzyme F420-dependent glucose-6-phosphate dehydrogenase